MVGNPSTVTKSGFGMLVEVKAAIPLVMRELEIVGVIVPDVDTEATFLWGVEVADSGAVPTGEPVRVPAVGSFRVMHPVHSSYSFGVGPQATATDS